jgi:integrase
LAASGRWFWKVRLPGQSKRSSIPLIPGGAKAATMIREIAEETAKELYHKAVMQAPRGTVRAETIGDLIQWYKDFADGYYRNADGKLTGEEDNIRLAGLPLEKHAADLPCEAFGPLKLKEIRDRLIESGLSRGVINQRINTIRRMFKWAASEELIPLYVYQALKTVDGLKRGRSKAKETEPTRPANEANVRAVLPHALPTVAAMIELQLLTGMRSGEMTIMRPCDLETSGKIWYYRPKTHKTAYRGHERVVALGPNAQRVLGPFLKRKLDEYCFSPIESMRCFQDGA